MHSLLIPHCLHWNKPMMLVIEKADTLDSFADIDLSIFIVIHDIHTRLARRPNILDFTPEID